MNKETVFQKKILLTLFLFFVHVGLFLTTVFSRLFQHAVRELWGIITAVCRGRCTSDGKVWRPCPQ